MGFRNEDKVENLRVLGRTNLKVSEVGFGCCGIGGDAGPWGYGPTDDVQSREALQAALDVGCTFFDTADVYGCGHAETLLGSVLSKVPRNEVLIATKAGYVFDRGEPRQDFGPNWLRQALEASLRRLRTSYVDVFQLHNPPAGIVLDPAMAETIATLRKTGAARYFGVSVANTADAAACLRATWVDTLQVRYNMLSAEAAVVADAAARVGVAVIAREPLANGFLTGKYNSASVFSEGDFRILWTDELKVELARKVTAIRASLAPGQSLARTAVEWVLRSRSVSVVIVGCKTASHVYENFCGVAGQFPPG